ncbi:pyridoxal phosphate-dependent decarboxylase family protein [Aegicerativicinus sediminis]|uniref:pyridoxal phosphate-dependent decarboxylase family protein n=1 Tax=Aegicerativicinus sediminis TaxID=2893202 RepID=UPI001E4D9AFB|nr:aminotransferase class V-fold PLP-dependent enzyme [Aegicerativicinus sediminis]
MKKQRIKNLNSIDLESVEMTFDIIKYVINRLSDTKGILGNPKSEEQLKELVGETITEDGIGGEKALELFRDVLSKATISEDHPRNLAFVPAAPSKASILFDLVTAASSIHGAYWMMGAGGIFCENEAMRWLVSNTGLPETAFGVFTSGGTAANLSAMLAAREVWLEKSEINKTLKSLLITSNGAHSSIKQMAKVLGSDVILVEDGDNDNMNGEKLNEVIKGLQPYDYQRLFAVVATSGTTNAGIIDELDEIAEVCQKHNIWFHVDGAYGGAAIVVPELKPLFKGIEKADSITIDPHKWLFTPYDCGAIIYRDIEQAKKAHTQKGTYLEIFKDEGARGFNPSDYQLQLSRRTRGMPLWFSIAMHGTKAYESAVRYGVTIAKKSADLIKERDYLRLIREPSLSVVLFQRKGWEYKDYTNWTYENLQKGFALVTPTTWTKDGSEEVVARFCFINPETTIDDVKAILDSME